MASPSPPDNVPVNPDSVRVWRGFRRPDVANSKFFDKLATVFIPGTVLIQQPVGLAAYLPTVLPISKPPGVPDEIALVFYEYQKAYDEAKETVGGRAYADMHDLIFDLGRSLSGFPIPYQGQLKIEEKYHLFAKKIDWQHGHVNVFVGARGGNGFTEFRDKIAQWATQVQSQGDKGPDGAIVSISWDYMVYWENWSTDEAAKSSSLDGLGKLVDKVHQDVIAPCTLPVTGLWEKFDKVEVKGGESFNFQFRRR